METAWGIAGHCQNTSRVSGGNNGAVSTTYIALFRVDQRQMQFSSGSPLSISDGDQVIIAGRLWRGALYADAVRNVTTGVTKHSGVAARIFLALVVLLFGAFASWMATLGLGARGGWISFSPPSARLTCCGVRRRRAVLSNSSNHGCRDPRQAGQPHALGRTVLRQGGVFHMEHTPGQSPQFFRTVQSMSRRGRRR